eukprot:6875388-Prymnesium_polylepis.1
MLSILEYINGEWVESPISAVQWVASPIFGGSRPRGVPVARCSIHSRQEPGPSPRSSAATYGPPHQHHTALCEVGVRL